ncbi:MAG: D-alanyl-D-alanine carboxypeptidase family protein [Nitrosomonadaceae bacterium]
MKRSLLFVLLLASSFVIARQSTNQAPPQPVLSMAAKAYILTDFQSGQTLVGQNIHKRVEPASLTKIMTAHVTFSALKQKRITLTQTVPVSENAWHVHGSRMFIEPGKSVTVGELVRGLIVQSGNDASIALAEAIAGSEESFAQMMNKEAERLGMKNTHFANSTGLPHPEHYTTAHDLALLVTDMIRNFPEHYQLYSIREYTYNKISQTNRNRLLWLDPNVDGLKTGYTQAAGYCLVTSARRNERRLISIVLGTTSDNARTIESQRLLNYGFQFYDTVRLYRKRQEVTTIQLWKGKREMLKTGFNRDLYFSLPKGQTDKLKATMEYKQPLIAPISAGQKVGVVKFAFNGEPIAERSLVALETIDHANIFSRTWDSLLLLFN